MPLIPRMYTWKIKTPFYIGVCIWQTSDIHYWKYFSKSTFSIRVFQNSKSKLPFNVESIWQFGSPYKKTLYVCMSVLFSSVFLFESNFFPIKTFFLTSVGYWRPILTAYRLLRRCLKDKLSVFSLFVWFWKKELNLFDIYWSYSRKWLLLMFRRKLGSNGLFCWREIFWIIMYIDSKVVIITSL